ncbi:MAG: 2,3-bisphosphoglycerate-independent phosphoglycerate mutase [Treponema sp.]|nr:2,3-bisphosphoglycerate-independent phosphoglycerate mutase [Treponema sp.]
MNPLIKNPVWKGRKGPVVLIIMDGVGYGKYKEGDAVADAKMDAFNSLRKANPNTVLKAHGKAVGLPSDDDMGNSEVGHNAMGCGRVFNQGAALVSEAIASRAMFEGSAWKEIIANLLNGNGQKTPTLHFIGLFSDGNVHSHLDHLKAMILQAKKEGVKQVRVHVLFDGRDVGETSALEYVDPFEAFLKENSDTAFDAKIGSGGGRMWITMDRYGADWEMVHRGWNTHVHGKTRAFKSTKEAVETYRKEIPGIIDQDLKEFVIAGEDGKPIGTIEDGDAVVYFNFRGDRSLEITAAFEDDTFDKFDRGKRPAVCYAGMMEYDGDTHVPKRYLVSPPAIDKTLGEYLAASGVRTLAISETQKYGHVTYFFNGNRTGKFDEKLEDYEEIKSDVIPFEQRPWMKCADIADRVIQAIGSGKYDFIRLNFPNGDMVGHTGIYQAVVCSMEGMDIQLGRIRKAVDEAGAVMIITADHGNSDDMYEHDKKSGAVSCKADGSPKAKTSHSLNPVPCIIYDPAYQGEYERGTGGGNDGALKDGLGISSIAATCIELLGFIPPEDYDSSVLKIR